MFVFTKVQLRLSHTSSTRPKGLFEGQGILQYDFLYLASDAINKLHNEELNN